jgi:hypothetical protein
LIAPVTRPLIRVRSSRLQRQSSHARHLLRRLDFCFIHHHNHCLSAMSEAHDGMTQAGLKQKMLGMVRWMQSGSMSSPEMILAFIIVVVRPFLLCLFPYIGRVLIAVTGPIYSPRPHIGRPVMLECGPDSGKALVRRARATIVRAATAYCSEASPSDSAYLSGTHVGCEGST